MPFAEEKDFVDYLAEQKKKSSIELLKEAALISRQINDRIKLLQELKEQSSMINTNFAHVDKAREELELFEEAVRQEIKARK